MAVDRAGLVVTEETDGQAWDAWLERTVSATSAHCYGWRQVIERSLGQSGHYFSARDTDGSIVGILPLVRVTTRLFGDFAVSMPHVNYGGVLAESPGVARALVDAAVDYAQEAGISHVEMRDTAPLQGWPERTDKVVMEMELPNTVGALGKQVGAKLRSQVKRPLREGATVEHGGRELLAEFYAVFSRNMRDLGTPVYPMRFFEEVLNIFAKEARIFVVRVGGEPTASGLVMGYRDRLEIPWASSLREYNRIGVNMLLYWEVLRYAIDAGYRVFDFGRSSKESGTYRFKAQWGARPRQLYWHYWLKRGQEMPGLTPSNPRFELAIRLWQKLPVSLANLLGPHIIRGLP